ncbi:MAG: C40 family peptidase [Bacteroidia bacterium]|nr:C40 family peptidase [Bacteroidia bacterium]
MVIRFNLHLIHFITIFLIIACKSKKKLSSNNTEVYRSNLKTVAEILSTDEKNIQKNELYRFISEWYGTPYSYASCSKAGVDCSCFTNMLYQRIYNINLPRSSKEIYEKCHKIKKNELKEGDLVFFNTNGKGVSHVGIYLKDGKFVHASTKKGVIISRLDEDYYQKTYCGACKKE